MGKKTLLHVGMRKCVKVNTDLMKESNRNTGNKKKRK